MGDEEGNPEVLSFALIDCRDLLRRYIEHVSYSSDGSDYTCRYSRSISSQEFTDDEWALLERLSSGG